MKRIILMNSERKFLFSYKNSVIKHLPGSLFHLIILTFFTFFIISCGNDLSKSHAQELITKKYKFPVAETLDIEKSYLKTYSNYYFSEYGGLPQACIVRGTNYSGVKKWLTGLEQSGLIELSEEGPIGNCKIYRMVVSLTKEGRYYLVSEDKDKFRVKISDIVFGTITGIITHEQQKYAEVNYDLVRRHTPFGNYQTKNIISKNERFSLFDDGWRIAK